MSRMHPLRAILSVLLLGAAACQTPSSRIDRLYADLEREVARLDPTAMPSEQTALIHEQRADSVRKVLEDGELTDPHAKFQAAVILVDTRRIRDIELAEKLAREAAVAGEPYAPRVIAEAVDKKAMLEGRMQKYGTQFFFEWVLDRWSLWPVDPMTTDADRAAMGVPTYAELLRAEDETNRAHGKKTRPSTRPE